MSKRGKTYDDSAKAYDHDRLYPPAEGLELVKSLAKKKFDETVEVAVRLGVDPRKADQMIRGTVSLPHGTGKTVRVAVFAEGDAAREAEAAGADFVGAEDLVKKVEGRLPRLRRRDRDARHDGPGRQARSHARPAWPDAEPEDGHRHHRRRQGRQGSSRPARSSTAPTATATCTCRSARRASSPRRWSRTTSRCSTRSCAPSRRRRRASTSSRWVRRRRWDRA